eukprot:3999567-Amphidinium_carterae.5
MALLGALVVEVMRLAVIGLRLAWARPSNAHSLIPSQAVDRAIVSLEAAVVWRLEKTRGAKDADEHHTRALRQA